MPVNRTPRRRRNPFYSNLVAGVGITVGDEGGNAIALACQLRDIRGNDVRERTHIPFYLSTDANGDTPAHGIHAPSGGWAVGTDGTLVKGDPSPNALYAIGTLAISATAERFKTTSTATFQVGGGQFTKAATDNLTFTAAHVVSATKFGVILVQINAAGTVSTKVPSATQAYNSAALALAALPQPDAGNVALGYITIEADAGAWTANTDDLTDASDLTAATFVDAPANGVYPAGGILLSEADGDIDITITETRVKTFYANFLLPDGGKVTSDAIAFA